MRRSVPTHERGGTQDIAIYGAGGFGREVQMLIEQINQESIDRIGQHGAPWRFVGFFDDGRPAGERVRGAPVLGAIERLNAWETPLAIVVAVGDPKTKRRVVESVQNPNIWFGTLIHPSVLHGDDFRRIGEGTVLCAHCIVTVDTTIGAHVLLNLACTVGHDAVIGDYCSLMPSVNVSGEVTLDPGVYAGTGAQIINRLRVGAWATLGAGAVVTSELPEGCTAVGIPARPLATRAR